MKSNEKNGLTFEMDTNLYKARAVVNHAVKGIIDIVWSHCFSDQSHFYGDDVGFFYSYIEISTLYWSQKR